MSQRVPNLQLGHTEPLWRSCCYPHIYRWGNNLGMTFFHLLNMLISSRKAEWAAVTPLLESNTKTNLWENIPQEELHCGHFYTSEVTSSTAAIYPSSPSGEGGEGSQHISNLLLISQYPALDQSVTSQVCLLVAFVIWGWRILTCPKKEK